MKVALGPAGYPGLAPRRDVGQLRAAGELMWGAGSRTPESCSLCWTSSSLGGEGRSVGSAEGWSPCLLARSLMDADTSLECWAQAASSSSAVIAKLWPLSCLMGWSQVERRVVHPIANPLRHLYCV